VHLIGFTIEIYYDARPYERQTQFNVNTSIGSRGVPCGRADPTDVTKLIVAFRNFANALKDGTFPVSTPPLLLRVRPAQALQLYGSPAC
jgi:hypothetical protein